MRRSVLPASLMIAILLTAGAFAALRAPEDAFDAINARATAGALYDAARDRPATEAAAAAPSPAPVDAAGWQALGRSESAAGRHAEAVVAFRNATRLRPDDAALLVDYAFSAAATTRRTEVDDPEHLVEMALQLAPTNPKALTLAGTLALDRGDYETAAQDWEQLARLEPADSPVRREVEASAVQARQLADAHASANANGHYQLARVDIKVRSHQ